MLHAQMASIVLVASVRRLDKSCVELVHVSEHLANHSKIILPISDILEPSVYRLASLACHCGSRGSCN